MPAAGEGEVPPAADAAMVSDRSELSRGSCCCCCCCCCCWDAGACCCCGCCAADEDDEDEEEGTGLAGADAAATTFDACWGTSEGKGVAYSAESRRVEQ